MTVRARERLHPQAFPTFFHSSFRVLWGAQPSCSAKSDGGPVSNSPTPPALVGQDLLEPVAQEGSRLLRDLKGTGSRGQQPPFVHFEVFPEPPPLGKFIAPAALDVTGDPLLDSSGPHPVVAFLLDIKTRFSKTYSVDCISRTFGSGFGPNISHLVSLHPLVG